jgi:hypothetical protein
MTREELRDAVAEALEEGDRSPGWAYASMADAAIAIVVEACAKLAGECCVCAPFWKDYNRTDPQCVAHDLPDAIRSLTAKEGR